MNGWSTGFIDQHPVVGQQLIFVADLMLIGILYQTVFAAVAAVAGVAYSVFLIAQMIRGRWSHGQLMETGVTSLILAVVALVGTWHILHWELVVVLVGWVVAGVVALVVATRHRG